MLATGGSIIHTLSALAERGVNPEMIRVLSVVAAPPALKKVGENYPEIQIYSAMIDEQVNDQGFIIPGLGDAGDRSFGT